MIVNLPPSPSAAAVAHREARRLRMVVLASAVLLLVALAAAPARNPIEERLLGAWTGEVGEHHVTLVLRRGGQCVLRLGTADATDLRVLFGKYRVWALKRPVALTIDRVAELAHPLHASLVFHGDDVIELSEFAPVWRVRPIAVNGGGQPIRLTRLPEVASR